MKKPDIVVWDENRGYYAKELTYGSNLSAPSIKLENVNGWRRREVSIVNRQFESKYNELIEQYKKLLDEYETNQLIYEKVQYNFIPIIGELYFLYKRSDGSLFLSLIEPTQFKHEFMGTFKLDTNNKWNKIN
jgi:hypothetical protein